MHSSRPQGSYSSGPPQPAPKLGELLIEMGLLTGEQLQVALERQKQDRRRLGSILVELGLINETRLVKALSRQLGIEVCDPITAPVHEMVRSKVSHRSARELRVVPIALKREASGDRLFVATSDPLNNDARRKLQQETGMRVEWLLAGETELELALARHYGTERPSFVLESIPPRPRSSRPSARASDRPGPPAPISSLPMVEAELDIPMEAPVDASMPPDVSDALEPLPMEEVSGPEPRGSMRTISGTPPPELERVGPPPGVPSGAPLFAARPSQQPSWGEVIAGPPSDPSAVLLGPHRAARSSPAPAGGGAARPSEDPIIEAVDHIGMTGDLLPQSRFLRSSLSPLSSPPSGAVNRTSSGSWRPSARPGSAPSAGPLFGAPALASDEPPLLELSEAQALPLPPAGDDARSTELELDVPIEEVAAPEASTSSSLTPRVSDLSGLEVESIASVLSASVEGEGAVALMVSAAPPPRPRPEQEARMLAAQVRQEMKDFLRGEVTPEARSRVVRTLVAILEDEGFFSDERLLRAVSRVLQRD